ncbi:MAG: M2 family metallopeptidase [Candidatus Krumholzibacteriia bacterium]
MRRLAVAGAILLAAGVLLIVLLGRRDQAPSGSSLPRVAADPTPPSLDEVTTFLDDYNANYRALWTTAEVARWQSNVDISEDNTRAAVKTAQALADYVGSRKIIDQLQRLRQARDLSEIQERQLDRAWQEAARYPGTSPATVRKLITAEAVQGATLHGHVYRLTLPGQAPREVTTGELDRLLRETIDPKQRLTIWNCSQTVGPPLKDGLAELQSLRNAVARTMGYSSYFSLQAADYDMSGDEIIMLMDDLVEGIRPLYEQLHCWVRHELAARYGVTEAPRLLPAHWLPDRYGSEWPGVVSGVDLDGMLRNVSPQWIIEQGERFYMSLGFSPLPLTFWGRSDLYELPVDANRRKSTVPSAWHIDLDQDVRALMSVRNDMRWFREVHRQLGHVYYDLSYARPEVPPILRRGANRALHAAVGDLAELASSQMAYLLEIELIDAVEAPDQVRWLLNQALTGAVVSIPFVCGTVTHWEHDLYEGELPRHQYNARWWEYAERFQGVAPPGPRGEELCDPATVPDLTENPGRAYDQALAVVIMHQLHRYICREILDQDVHEADYYGNTQVGIYLESILAAGAMRDWSRLLYEATGEPLSASAMLDYYEPLLSWLREQNQGRVVGFERSEAARN